MTHCAATYSKRKTVVDGHTYYYTVDVRIDESRKVGLLSKLPADEQERYARFRRMEDKDMFLASRTALREEIERQLHIPYNTPFTYNECRKPFLSDFPDYHFNISHSMDVVMLGFSEFPVGVDIEFIVHSPKDCIIEMASVVFHPAEIDLLKQQTVEDCPYFFTKLWTLKESFTKAMGYGFCFDTKGFALNELVNKDNGVWETNEYKISFRCSLKDKKQINMIAVCRFAAFVQ